jgi:mercuric ion transport protein
MRERSPHNAAHAANPAWLLASAAALSLLASACCVLPLLLVALGLSAAWLVPVRPFTRYWPLFILGAIVALVLAKRRMRCETAICAADRTAAYTFVFWAIVTWTGVALFMPLLAPLLY